MKSELKWHEKYLWNNGNDPMIKHFIDDRHFEPIWSMHRIFGESLVHYFLQMFLLHYSAISTLHNKPHNGSLKCSLCHILHFKTKCPCGSMKYNRTYWVQTRDSKVLRYFNRFKLLGTKICWKVHNLCVIVFLLANKKSVKNWRKLKYQVMKYMCVQYKYHCVHAEADQLCYIKSYSSVMSLSLLSLFKLLL